MTTAARRRVERHLAQPYRIAVERTGDGGRGGWTAHVEELDGCTATGATAEEAEARVRAAMRRWFEQAIAEGREIPAPRGQGSSHSGRLLLRMPGELHAELAAAAEREGVSLNQLIVGLLSSSVAADAGEAAMDDEPEGLDDAPAAGRESRLLRTAIVANLVVLVVAGAIAVVLLVLAVRDGV